MFCAPLLAYIAGRKIENLQNSVIKAFSVGFRALSYQNPIRQNAAPEAWTNQQVVGDILSETSSEPLFSQNLSSRTHIF